VSSIAETLAQAKSYHRSGQLRDAEQCYRRALESDGSHAEAHYLLGAVLAQQGQLDEAIASFERALLLRPDSAEIAENLRYVRAVADNNRGNALAAEGKLDEAVACYRRVLALRPDYTEAHNNLGTVLAEQSKWGAAISCYRRALELTPAMGEAHMNLGVALSNQGAFDEAVACHHRAIELKPDLVEARIHLAVVLTDQNKLDEAAACCRRVLELRPDFAKAYDHLARVLRKQNKLDEAAACCRRALELNPDFADAQNTLALVLWDQCKLDEAVACCRRALELNPDFAEALDNLALVLRDQHKLDEALGCCWRALELKPDFAEAHFNHSVTLLMMGRFAAGWLEFEWRWKRRGVEEPAPPQPRWTGSALAGRTILLRSEYGLGDTLQFIRYVNLVRQQGGTAIVEVQPPLVPLLEQSGFRGLLARGAPLPDCDVYAPLLSLPSLFGTTLENVPGGVPYLSADVRRVEHWRDVLRATDDLKVGIAWQGNAAYIGDRFRSIPLARFAPLAQAGVELISLQKGFGSEQLAGVADKFLVRDLGDRVDAQHGAFVDTAAIMMNLDLVVTSDSAVAHLAGALGVPVWVPLAFAPDWRWMLGRNDSPWYPTMRLFRQDAPGEWDAVFQRIQSELSSAVKNRCER
jgi:tetratricopeptide (TPR) repeat protein